MFREVRSFFVRRCCSAKQFAQDPQQSTGDTGLAQQLEQDRNEKRHEDTPFLFGLGAARKMGLR